MSPPRSVSPLCLLKRAAIKLCLGLSCSVSALSGSLAQPSTAPEAAPEAARPHIERLDESRIKLGGMIVDRKRKEVIVPALINLNRGILEYYAVVEGGKLHESVLKLLIKPSDLHLALILAGFEPSEYGPQDPKTYQRPLKKRGSLVRLYVKWTPAELKREQWLPASVWLFDRALDNAPEPLTYVFQGSVMSQGKYMADLDMSVIGLIPDETTVLALIEDKGNPYRGDRQGYEAHTSAMPKVGAELSLVIREASAQQSDEVARGVELMKRLNEERARQAQVEEPQLPSAPPFIISLPSLPSSSLPYQERP